MKAVCFMLTTVILLTRCSGSSDNSGSIEEKIDNAMPRSKQNPCDFLEEAEVRKITMVDEAITITRSDTYGICNFKWEIESEKPTDEETLAAAMDAVKSGKMGNLKRLQQGFYSVGLNFSPLANAGKTEAKNAFDTAKRTLTEGMTVTKEEIKEKAKDMGIDNKALEQHATDITFQDKTLTDINGVGDGAFWSSQSSQLTVLAGKDLFFLTVKGQKDPETSLELARKFANLIIKKL